MKRRAFLNTLASIPFVLPASKTARAKNAPKKPNIIFIMADDLGYGHLGCYGQTKIDTPNLDRMAAEGMRFTQCYAGAPVCAPSRSALMTGYHGGHTAVRGNTGGIPLAPDDVTVAELLKKVGYKTGLFGKWGLGEHETTGVPYKQGFDEFFGWLHQIHAHFYYPEYLWHNDKKYVLEGNDGKSGLYAHDVIVDKAFDFIRRQTQSQQSGGADPFFLYMPLAIPHYELLVPEESLKKYRGKFPETPYNGRGKGVGYPLDYASQKTPKAAIAAMITHMDKNIGRLFALLKELNIDEDTIVIFTSDNGPSYGPGEPEFFNASGGLRGVKASLYEGGIRVPMMARWPGNIHPGSTAHHPCYFPDVMPTLAELAGVPSPKNIDGLSFAPTLRIEQQKEHDVMYWEMGEGRAVRMGKWKAVHNVDEVTKQTSFELFDLDNDPCETKNVASQYPAVAAKAKIILKEQHVDMRPQIEPKKPEGRQYR